jgi:hypothetical protein
VYCWAPAHHRHRHHHHQQHLLQLLPLALLVHSQHCLDLLPLLLLNLLLLDLLLLDLLLLEHHLRHAPSAHSNAEGPQQLGAHTPAAPHHRTAC